MKTIVNFASKTTKRARNFPIGSLLIVTDDVSARGHILLSTYDRFVSLNNPSKTWLRDCTLEVRLLNPGDSVTLIQE